MFPLRRLVAGDRRKVGPYSQVSLRVHAAHRALQARSVRVRLLDAVSATYAPSMPTVFRTGPYRFFFYSGDREEPAHVHVEREGNQAKYWLLPVRLAGSEGFARHELRRMERLVSRNAEVLVERWNEFFAR